MNEVLERLKPLNPYKFLDYFEPQDADIFCGRKQEIRQLQYKFHRTRLLILHGESGTGKTSLIRAGLIPRLPTESYIPVYVRALQEPTLDLKEAMIHQLGADRQHLELPLVAFLETETAHLSKTVVIILDQFEEFFLRFPFEVRQPFHRELGACVAADHLDVRVIISLRDDYFSALSEFKPAIPELFTHEMRLNRLTFDQALEAVVEPAQRAGLTIDEELVTDVILPQLDETGEGVEPPLLQIVCDALYQHAYQAERTTVGTAEYVALGDIRETLGHYLDTVLRQFGQEQPQARAVLKALVTVEGTKQASLAPEMALRLQTMGVDLTEKKLVEHFLSPLVHARLVRADEIDGHTRYELTHEFLVQKIEAWIAQHERELTTVLELIDRSYAAYQTTSLVLAPEALSLISPWRQELVLPPEKQEFVDLSYQSARRKQRGLWFKVGILLLAVALVISGLAAWQLYRSNQQLQREKTHAETQRLAAEKAKETAESRTAEAKRALMTLYTEQGRQELLQDKPARAAAYLNAAYVQTPQDDRLDPALRFLMGRALQRLSPATLQGHTHGIMSVLFSADGTRLVTGSRDGTVRWWDARSGEALATLQGHQGPVYAAAFSPDGSQLVTGGGDGTARLWDVNSGVLRMTLQGSKDSWQGVPSVVFSPDGSQLVTGSEDTTARLWDIQSGMMLWTLQGHTGPVYAVAFSPDGTQLVTGSEDGTARLWDARSGAPVATLQGHTDSVWALAFSPDGTRLVTGGGWNKKLVVWHRTRARLWDTHTGALLATLQDHPDETIGGTAVAFSPDGKYLATGNGNGTVRLWDARSGSSLKTFQGHTLIVMSVAFSPDGTRLATGSGDGTAGLWDTHSGAPLAMFREHTAAVTSVTFSPDGTQLVTGSEDTTARLWNTRSRGSLVTLQGHTHWITSVAFSPDSTRLVTASEDHTARLWDVRSGAPVATLQGHTDSVWSLACSPDGTRLVTASWDGTARLWDANSGRSLATLQAHADWITSLAFSPDGTRLVTASEDHTARLWDARSGAPVATLQGHTGGVWTVAFSPDGTRLVTGSADFTARLWDTRSGISLAILPGHTSGVKSVAFSPNGALVITGSKDHTARLWDARSGAPVATLQGHTDTVEFVAFSPNGMHLVTGSKDHTARLWDARSGAPVATLQGHTGGVGTMAFSPDGALLATGSADKTARLWDARSGVTVAALRGHTGGVATVAFSPDGTRLVTGSKDTTARLWDVHLETRTIGEVAAFVACRVPWIFREGRLVQIQPDPDACSGQSVVK